jgi:AAA family ATP:ADP antiporter
MGVVSAIYPRALRLLGLYSLIRVTSLIAISNLLAFWWLVERPGVAWFYVLYIWVSLFGATTASQAWSLATQVFDAREARRAFAWIGLGGVVGGIGGGVITRFLAPRWGTVSLLPICAPLMLMTVFLLKRLTPAQTESRTSSGEEAGGSATSVVSQIRHSRYLLMMVGLLVVGVIVEAFVDYEFKSISKGAFASRDALTSFFGTIAFYGGILALLVQTVFTSAFLKRFGVGYTIMLLPSAFLGAFLLIASRPTLWAVSILKLIDGSLSYSVHRSGMELLYVPISQKQRAAIKGLIDLLVDRAGRALGGVLLLLLTFGLSFSIPALSLVAGGFLVAWLVMAFIVRRDYINAFRVALEKKVVQPEAIDVRSLDQSIIRNLVQALSSEDERQVLYALNLLGQTHPSNWRSSETALLAHKSPAVRSRAIALLADWKGSSSQTIEAMLTDPDMEVRAEAIRYLCVTAPQQDAKLREFTSADDYQLVLSAVHYLTKYGGPVATLIDNSFIDRAMATRGEHATSARIAAARALAMAPGDRSGEHLDTLMRDESLQVVQEAIRSAAKLRYEPAIPRLISLLAVWRFRLVAREALLKIGAPALAELQRQLRDERTPIEVRARIPKVLSFTGKQQISDLLLGSVHNLSPQIDMALLKALNRMRKQYPEIEFDTERVSLLIKQQFEIYQQWTATMLSISSSVPPVEGSTAIVRLLEKTLKEKLEECVEKTFRLLGLIYSPDDVYSTYFSLSSRPALRGSAVEFLDNLLDPELRPHVVPMVESSALESEQNQTAQPSWAEMLDRLSSDGDPWLTLIAEELSGRIRERRAPPRIA